MLAKSRSDIDEEFRVYRHSGLGLSATVIALCVLCLKAVGEAMAISQFRTPLGYTWAVLLCASITAAVAFQVLHYEGYRNQAVQYYPETKDRETWQHEHRILANRLFKWAERMVTASVGLLVLGAILSAWLWLNRVAVPRV